MSPVAPLSLRFVAKCSAQRPRSCAEPDPNLALNLPLLATLWGPDLANISAPKLNGDRVRDRARTTDEAELVEAGDEVVLLEAWQGAPRVLVVGEE